MAGSSKNEKIYSEKAAFQPRGGEVEVEVALMALAVAKGNQNWERQRLDYESKVHLFNS